MSEKNLNLDESKKNFAERYAVKRRRIANYDAGWRGLAKHLIESIFLFMRGHIG